MNTGKIGSLKTIKPVGLEPANLAREKSQSKGVEFRDALQKQLDKKIEDKKTAPLVTLQFSAHAVERMQKRGINFSPEDISRIEAAANRALEKGASESLLLTEDSALIVDLKEKKVVTVMDREMLKENVFTNIDSTVFV